MSKSQLIFNDFLRKQGHQKRRTDIPGSKIKREARKGPYLKDNTGGSSIQSAYLLDKIGSARLPETV